MTTILGFNLLPALLTQQDPSKTDEAKREESLDTFTKSSEERDFKKEIIDLATGEIPSIDFEIKKDGFKLESILPKRALRHWTKVEMTIDGKKYTSEYYAKAPVWDLDKDGGFESPGFYFRTSLFKYASLDTVLKKGSKVSMAKPNVPVYVQVLDKDPFLETIDVIGDGRPDIKHSEAVCNLLESKLDKLGIQHSILYCNEEYVEDQEDLLVRKERPDLILLPYGNTIRWGNNPTSKKAFEARAGILRAKLKAEKLYKLLELNVLKGSLVFVGAGNRIDHVSQFLPGRGIIGVSGKDASGNIVKNCPKNDFIDMYGQYSHRLDFVTDDDGSLLGFDIDQDGKADFSDSEVDEYTYDIWEFLKPLVGNTDKTTAYTPKEISDIFRKLSSGYKYELLEDGEYKIPVLKKDNGKGKKPDILKLTKVFTRYQFNRLMEEMGEKNREDDDNYRYFLFGQNVISLRHQNGRLEREVSAIDDSTGKEYYSLNGTSYAIVDPAVEAAKLGLHWLDGFVSPADKRKILGAEVSP